MILKTKTLFRFLLSAALVLLLGWLIFGSPLLVHADAILTIAPITWNVVGLDSNNVTVGPNNFPVGVRVCNTGDDPANNVTADFIWDSSDTYIDIRTGSLDPITMSTLAAGSCFDFYFEIEITRDANAYDHTRQYHIEVSSTETSTISTPTPREIYVEHLISQSRNSTTDVLLDGVSVAPGGTMALMLGNTYNIQLVGSTATNGYEQIESYINFPNTIFQINSVTSTYTANSGTDPEAVSKVYADGCGWENDPNSPNYRSCLSTGKYGGDITVTYNVTIIGGAGTSETLNTLIYDFSGSSYHYNSDFSVAGRIAAIVDPSLITIDKNFVPDPTSVTGTSTLTFTLSNPNDVAISGASFTDTFPTSPGAMTVASPATYSTNSCGTPTFAPTAGAGSISFSDGTIPANGSCTVSVQVSTTATGTYDNTSSNLLIGTTDTGNSASDSLVVNDDPLPPPCTPGLELATWTFPGLSTTYTFKSNLVSSATENYSGTGTPSIDTAIGNPVNSWKATGGWASDNTGFPNPAAPYFEFVLDTSNFTGVSIAFDYHLSGNWSNPNDNFLYVYSSADGGAFSSIGTPANPIARNRWFSYPSIAAVSTGSSTTTFRINAVGQQNNTAALHLDNVAVTGCGVPYPPSLTKAFSPDPIAVNDLSTLTFTITNENNVTLTGLTFTDALPSGVQVAAVPAASTTCGGAPTWAPASGDTNLVFGNPFGGTVPARVGTTNGSCTVQVDVTATTAGPHTNVSGFISSTETGPNTGPDGSATDTLTAISPPSISKQFAPNPILVNGTSTLTFTITNPNPDDGLTNVAFSDSYPAGLINETPANSSTTCTGGTVTAADGGGSVSLSGATITGGGSCTVQVDVTSATVGSYANTSGAVTADIVGGTDTASDSLVVEPVRPSISLLKQVSTSATGPWTSFIGVATGADIYYQFTVENTGDVPLSSVSVSDPTLAGTAADPVGCAWTDPLPVAAPGNDNHIEFCVEGPITAVSGSNPNTATATGTYSGAPYTDTSTATYATTGLTLDKSSAQSTFQTAGDVLDYSYLVTNTGFAPLLGPVTIDDDRATDESCPAVDTVGDNDAYLDPGESITRTATYTVTAGDVTAGFVTNIADATVDGVTSNTDSETVTAVVAPTVTKLFTPDTIASGGTSTLTITIVNPNTGTGLTGVGYTDNLPAGVEVASPPRATTTNCGTPTFTPGAGDTTLSFSGGTIAASGTCTVEVDVTSSTPGTVTNTTSVVSSNEAPDSGTAADDLTVVNPELTLVKTVTSGDPYSNVGDVLSYSFAVTNSGNVTLDGPFTVADDRATDESCPATATLAPGASITCTASYTVTQTDIDNGSVTNTATASGLFGGNPVTSGPDSETANATQTPAIQVVKEVSVDGGSNWQDANSAPGPSLGSGTDPQFRFTVTNNGNVTLSNIGLSDTDMSSFYESDLSTACTIPGTLGPGVSFVCYGELTWASGQHTDTATGSGDFNSTTYSDTDDANYFGGAPALTLVKSETSTGPYNSVGDVIDYDLVATNSGNVALTNVTISDPTIGALTCVPVQPAGLAVGASMTCTGSYTITQADLDSGSVSNTGTADSAETGPETDTETVLLTQSPSLNVTKTESSTGPYGVGDTITYDIDVDNTGNVTLTGVTVSDPDTTIGACTPVQPSTLAPGATMTCPASYVVTQADVDAGSFTNTATGDSNETGPDTGSETVTFTQNPALNVTKSETSTGPYGVGDTITYDIDVDNTGNVTLTGVTASDPDTTIGACTPVQPSSLAPGATMTCPASYVVTQADVDAGSFTNTATGDSNEMGPDTDSETVTFTQTPSLNVTKSETSTGPYGVGDTITYDIDVDNTGNVTLTGVTASDPDTTIGACTPVQPSTLAPGATMTCPASYVVTQADVDAGSFTNTATGDSNETGPDTGSETVLLAQSPALALVKTITSGDPYSSVGDILNYSFAVTNSGNVTLDGPFTVADDRAADESCPPTATLAPGASITCTASYTVTQTDIDNGSVTNTATVSGSFGGNPVASAPDSETANAAALIVIDPGVTKSGDPLTAQIGDTVTFTLFVFNTGNADADNVIVTDLIPSFLDIIPPVVISPLGPGVTITGNTITMDFDTVEPSESWTVTITTVVNVLGVPPGDSNDVTLTTTSVDDDPNNNVDSVFIAIRGDGPLLPGTGFTPNRDTALPQIPADYTYLSYGELWLEIPKLAVDTSIVGVPRDGDGWDVTWLWDKAGYLGGTAFPTWSGNSVITGHVVLANGLEGPFADLKKLEYGDAVIVHGWGEQYVYEIREVDIVSPYDPSVLRHEEYPWLTLVTCAGFDETSDSYRWRVVARAVMMSIESEAGSWISSSFQEQHDIQTFDRVGSGGIQP